MAPIFQLHVLATTDNTDPQFEPRSCRTFRSLLDSFGGSSCPGHGRRSTDISPGESL